jgi:hypothetical protein
MIWKVAVEPVTFVSEQFRLQRTFRRRFYKEFESVSSSAPGTSTVDCEAATRAVSAISGSTPNVARVFFIHPQFQAHLCLTIN